MLTATSRAALVVVSLAVMVCLSHPANASPGATLRKACENVVRKDASALLFGSRVILVAEPFCRCLGDEASKDKRLGPADRSTFLSFLTGYKPTSDMGEALGQIKKLQSDMGDKYEVVKTLIGTCQDRALK